MADITFSKQVDFYRKEIDSIKKNKRVETYLKFYLRTMEGKDYSFKEVLSDKNKVITLVDKVLYELGIKRPSDYHKVGVLVSACNASGIDYKIYTGIAGSGTIPDVVYIEIEGETYFKSDEVNDSQEVKL